jgi:hypothetical protein
MRRFRIPGRMVLGVAPSNISAAGTRHVIGARLIRDALTRGIVKQPISSPNAYVEASTLLLSLRIVRTNHACFLISIFVFHNNSWVQGFAPIG